MISVPPAGTGGFVQIGEASRIYLLHWLFKYGGNADPSTVIPGGDFRDEYDYGIDDQKVQAFASTPTNYKLFNRLQIMYTITNGVPTVHVLRRESNIGTTTSPIGGLLFPGQHGPNNNVYGLYGSGTAFNPYRYISINDGSPDKTGVEIFHVLMGKDAEQSGMAPLYWENIGNQIRFALNGSTTPSLRFQSYPTYSIYFNGRLDAVRPQAASPTGNFFDFPYPFGAVPCPHPGNGDTPQGRCGDAEAEASTSSRIPTSQYTIR